MDKPETITRRAALLGGLSATAALTAAALPAAVAVAEPETSAQAIHRLGGEIARILADQPEGYFDKVEITADWIGQTRTYSPADAVAAVNKLIDAHRRAWTALQDACDPADRCSSNYGGKPAERRWAQVNGREIQAFLALLGHPTPDAYAAHAKATYLLGLPDGLERDHVDSLLTSMLIG